MLHCDPTTPHGPLDAEALLRQAGLAVTSNRRRVISCLIAHQDALSAKEILAAIQPHGVMNKVTLYRILEKCVAHGLLLRHSVGDRSFRYCLNSSPSPLAHCHFFCTGCGHVQCITMPCAQLLDLPDICNALPQNINSVEVRLDGLCRSCQRTSIP